VVIAIVAVLVAIVVPSLGGARRSGWQTKSLANIRTIGQWVSVYATDSQGLYPCSVPGREYPMAIPGVSASVSHWVSASSWPALLHAVAPWESNQGVYLAPKASRLTTGKVLPLEPRASYAYSSSFLGRPEIWVAGSVPDPALEAGRRESDVLFTSSKVLMWEEELPYLSKMPTMDGVDIAVPVPVLMADGSASTRIPSRATDAVRNPFTTSPYQTNRLANTPRGVRGNDY